MSRTAYAWLSWVFPASFFFIMYISRVAPASMMRVLMESFQASPGDMGILGSAFIQAYALMQLPVGMLADRINPVRLLVFGSFLAIVGNMLFACADTLASAYLARFVMGVGSSFIFVCALQQAKIWLPAQYFALACGVTQVLGMLGAAVGNNFLVLFHFADWRQGLIWLGYVWGGFWALLILVLSLKQDRSWFLAIALLLASALFFCIQHALFHQEWLSVLCYGSLGIGLLCYAHARRSRTASARERNPFLETWQGLKAVLGRRVSWLNGFYAGLVFLPVEVLGEWWGAYYLTLAHHVSLARAGFWVAVIFMGWALGGILIGQFVSGKHVRGWMIRLPLMACALLLLGLYWKQAPGWFLDLVFFGFGIFSAGLVLAYAISPSFHAPGHSGTAMAFTNVMSIILGAFFQPMIGYGVQFLTPGMGELLAFDVVMASLPMCLLLASFLAWCFPEA